jgi:nitric oxide reductase subunit C
MTSIPWWSGEDFWRKIAIWVTAVMFLVLIALTFDSVSQIQAGSKRVAPYSVINQRIYYEFDENRKRMIPVIGADAPLFHKKVTEAEAEEIITHGKLAIQAKNCMDCHTFLGNGSYYAPDLTKAWLDPGWGSEAVREELMLNFLLNPPANARTFGSGRKMPNLHLTETEARNIIAYLKWMSAIDTNGFPHNFRSIRQEK